MDDITRYLHDIEGPARKDLFTLQSLIHAFFPNASVSIQHRMPTYDLGQGISVSFANQKNYMAFYCCEGGLVEKYKKELPNCDVGKGCIRFKEADHDFLEVVKKILTELAEQLAG